MVTLPGTPGSWQARISCDGLPPALADAVTLANIVIARATTKVFRGTWQAFLAGAGAKVDAAEGRRPRHRQVMGDL
jgi:hypothetical protein